MLACERFSTVSTVVLMKAVSMVVLMNRQKCTERHSYNGQQSFLTFNMQKTQTRHYSAVSFSFRAGGHMDLAPEHT